MEILDVKAKGYIANVESSGGEADLAEVGKGLGALHACGQPELDSGIGPEKEPVDLWGRFTKWAWDRKDPLTGSSRDSATLGLLTTKELQVVGLEAMFGGNYVIRSDGREG